MSNPVEERLKTVRHHEERLCPLARAVCAGRECAWAVRQDPQEVNIVGIWTCGATISPNCVVDFDRLEWKLINTVEENVSFKDFL